MCILKVKMKRYTLKEYADQQGISYKTAHYQYKTDKIPHETAKEGNRIFVYESSRTPNIADDNYIGLASFEEITASSQSGSDSTSYRRNKTGRIVNTSDKYKHIEEGETPFQKDNNGYISVSNMIELCQKAYYNFAIFRETIELMTEFSTNPIFFRSKNKKAIDFFTQWSKYINLFGLQNKFFREYFRSGNVFLEKIESSLTQNGIDELNQTFKSRLSNQTLPTKYIILNPSKIKSSNALNFEAQSFFKELTPYEIERIKNPISPQDKAVSESLQKAYPEKHKEIMNNRYGASSVLIPLDSDNIYAVFYKKQDYEPFAIPMGFPVLEDLNAKQELKKIDMSVARTMQQVILKVTVGATIDDQPYINPDSMKAIKNIFTNESVGRVLVSDYTTEAEFIIPDIADILTPEKYQIIEGDIKIGLNNILIGSDEKFSNQSIKIDIFLERLKEARNIFMNEFLIPEVNRITSLMNFKGEVIPKFEEFKFKHNIDYARMYTRLAEINVLTPDEALKAIQTDVLPTPDESRESQREFKELREDELYVPPNAGAGGPEKQAGRPSGTPNSTQPSERKPRVQQIASEEEEKYSIDGIITTIASYNDLCSEIKKLHPKMSEDNINTLSESIITSYDRDSWKDNIKHCQENITKAKDEIFDIATNHNISVFQAAILYHSKPE